MTSSYLTNQLLTLCPTSPKPTDEFKLKLHSNHGETNWLSITKEQLHEIEGILCKGVENEN